MSWAGELNSAIENFFRDSEQTLNLWVDDTNRNRSGIVTNPTVANDADIHLNNIAVSDRSGTADAMNNLLV